ncbi:MAG: hypothetical protein ACK5A8_10085 [Flavobacteriia bacterium]
MEDLKNALYHAGASCAAMSGSGSSVYGIFEGEPDLTLELNSKVIYNGPWHY